MGLFDRTPEKSDKVSQTYKLDFIMPIKLSWRTMMQTRIQELRKINKLSQSELADALSVTRQTIISLEKGRYNASLELAYKIAKYFGKTIEDVFIFEDENRGDGNNVSKFRKEKK